MSASRTTTWEINQDHVDLCLSVIKREYKKGKKSSLVDPVMSDLIDPNKDGRVPPELPDQEFLTACARIGAFLMDADACILQLKKLNQLLKTNLENKDPNKSEVSVLRQTLQTELEKFGFHPQFGKTFGFVHPVAFRAAMAHGLMLKDAILGDGAHGEFSHPIQLLMIVWQQAETNFLGCNVIDIYKQLGHEKSVYERSPLFQEEYDNRLEKSIWDIIIDRFYPILVEEDPTKEPSLQFTTPTTLHKFIRESEDAELIVLRNLVNHRCDKRNAEGAKEKFKSKYTVPGLFYHKGNLPMIHEPKDCNISLMEFKKNSVK